MLDSEPGANLDDAIGELFILCVILVFLVSGFIVLVHLFDKIDARRKERVLWSTCGSLILIFAMLQIYLLRSASVQFEVSHSALVKLGAASLLMGLFAARLVFYLMRAMVSANVIKAMDYLYFAIGLLAVHINFSKMLDDENLFRDIFVLDLAMTAIALRITKTTAEIFRWHR